jgi:transposase
MKVVYPICCGIDVHAKMLVACLILADGEKKTRSFSTMTDDLLQLRDWLVAASCTNVVIESTGVYWKPVFNILDGAVELMLVNPEHVHALRGCKTDVKDSGRLADLLRHGLLQPSFIPPAEIRDLRELTRYRDSLVRERSSIANRIQKVIESANIKLGQVATDALGASGRAMLGAMAKGETDPVKLAEMARGKLREKKPQLIRALNGRLTTAQRFVLGELLERLNELEAAQARVNKQIDQQIESPEHPKLARAKKLLDSIPGVGPRVAEVIIAEIGVEMSEVFPTDAQLASWAGICPGNKASGGKRLSGRTRKGNTYLRSALVQAAWGLTKKKNCYLSAQYYRLVKRLGKKKALVAVAHSLLVIIYHVLERDQSYTELGGDYFDRQHTEQQRDYFIRRLNMLGLKVSVEELSGEASEENLEKAA